MNMYEGKLIMYACIIRETFVFTVFRRVFHSILKLELCRHACQCRDQIIPTCRYGKNMPTTALMVTMATDAFLKKMHNFTKICGHHWTHLVFLIPEMYTFVQVSLVMRCIRSHISLFRLGLTPTLID